MLLFTSPALKGKCYIVLSPRNELTPTMFSSGRVNGMSPTGRVVEEVLLALLKMTLQTMTLVNTVVWISLSASANVPLT